MEIAAHLDALDREGKQLARAAAAASLTDRVPGCPDWTVKDLLSHIGVVHRWAAAIVRDGVDKPTNQAEAAEATKPEDAGLLEWYAEGHRALVDTLHAAPAELDCFAFLPAPSPLAFWARRQALETLVHRADAEAAAAIPVEIEPSLAHDGIEEVLLGFGARPREFGPGTLRVLPSDGAAWDIAFTAQGADVTPSSDSVAADATVSGEVGQVYLWLWNRPAQVSVEGDQEVADRWKQMRIRWG